jgi:hypothetical protein
MGPTCTAAYLLWKYFAKCLVVVHFPIDVSLVGRCGQIKAGESLRSMITSLDGYPMTGGTDRLTGKHIV